MTQPHYYNVPPQFPYDNFQVLDAVYNDSQVPAAQTWVDISGETPSTYGPPFEIASYSVDQGHLIPTTNYGHTLQQGVSLGLIPNSPPSYGVLASFETFPVFSQYPRLSAPQIPVTYTSRGTYAPALPIRQLKRPVSSMKELKRGINDVNSMVGDAPKPVKKRKKTSTGPAHIIDDIQNKDVIFTTLQHEPTTTRSLEDCMGLFDTTLTATKEKRRRKLFSSQEKKAVQSVRNVGACIQCKFRKKTCSAGRPCPYCARVAGNLTLGAQLCHRESPFVDKSMIQYYPSTSRKRIIDFHLSNQDFLGTKQTLYIDGIGPSTYPLKINVLKCDIETFHDEDRTRIFRTVYPDETSLKFSGFPTSIGLLQPGEVSTSVVEKWALEYVYQYAKTKNSRATGFLFGIEYAARGLPHSDLVTKITRLVSLNFVLRAGIKIQSFPEPDATSPFRTIQAQIDTLLYQSFQKTEKSLYQHLQRLVFRFAGSLARDAVVPVCFAIWQLTRLQCMLASHLSNLAAHDRKRYFASTKTASSDSPTTTNPNTLPDELDSSPCNSNPNLILAIRTSHHEHYRPREIQAENLTHSLNLLLCTFQALFRTSCPLLLDWTDPFNKELLQNDEILLELATRMGKTLRGYRAKGHSRKFRLGFGYNKEMADRIRGLLKEK